MPATGAARGGAGHDCSRVSAKELFGIRITRDDLAACLLDTAADESAVRKHVNVAN
ncbi:hypothetical protein IFM12275_59080 [Nocardia sputorum]|nr:hypothetical protein IFM12275_59080 [Nocardia sputorum]